MLQQFDHALAVSYYLYAQNRAQSLAQSYFNAQLVFHPTPDAQLTGFNSYSCPWKPLVYDASVSGAQIVNMVSGGGFSAPLTRASGVHFDYFNGRVLVPAALGANLALTGYGAVSEFGFYVPQETQEYLLTQQKFFVNPRYQGTPTSGIAPYTNATPAVFVNSISDTNEAFAFGGLNETNTTFSLTCFMESDYQLKGMLSLFRDTRYKNFPLVSIAQNPLDGYNDTKGGSGGYNYNSIISQYGTPGQLVYIKSVRTSKVSDRAKLNPGLFCGLIDMELSYVRQTL